MSDALVIFVNGTKHSIRASESPWFEPARTTLLSFLRVQCRLTGAKLGCGEGGCGACTVLCSDRDSPSHRVRHRALNACLTLLAALDHCAIVTVEAVSNSRLVQLRDVQHRLMACGGSQVRA
jgi:xanthine dehydrogenase/oxidase